MSEIQEIKKTASEFRKNKQYSEALNLYQELWTNHRDVCNEWEGWGFAMCLRKLGDSEKALELCRETYQIKPDFENGKNLYAWCIYDTEIKKDDEQIEKEEKNFFKAANAILKLASQDQYSPYVKTIFRVIDYITKKNTSYPANDILQWVDKLNPQYLSKDPFSFMDKEQKHREIPSDQEKWYGIKTKALHKDGAYEQCIVLCEKAFTEINNFHYNNDTWFKRRIALSKAHLGDKKTAADELESILKNRKEWFIQYELAKIYYDLGEKEKAMAKAVEAALNFGKDENKWELFVFMAQILRYLGKIDSARNHLVFALKLREEKGWKIPKSLDNMITEFNVDSSETIVKKELFGKLKIFWETSKYSSLPCINGVVKTILRNGKAGFITGDDKKDYFFKVRGFKGDRKKLQEGLKVKFNLEDSFDRKKNKKTKAAINIREII